MMGRFRRYAALTLLCILAFGGAVAAVGRAGQPQRVYSVSQVASALAHRAPGWAGRTILVHGTALLLVWDECTGGHDQNGLDLVDRLGPRGTRRTTLCLQLGNGILSPTQEAIFRIPLIGPSLVGYQQIVIGQPKTYRVTFPRHLPTFCRAWSPYSGPWPCLAVAPNSAHG